MTGRSYTMKEMKAIVEYLTEHRAYGDTKGRKMWMNLASCKVTNRTWQSLKETFLKRILPDIHNPYYNLSLTQISSFQQGQDIEVRLKNKLQIQSTSQNLDSGVKESDTEEPGTSNGKNEENTAGEDPKLTNLRASTETLVLENCLENSEELRRDLQSPVEENCYANCDELRKDLQSPVDGVDEKEMQPTKSMRELITYSEPLTPMLQSVIDDFVTDDEECEPKMQIVEPEETTEKNDENGSIVISDSDSGDVQETNQNLTKNPNIDHTESLNENEQAIVPSNAKETETVNEKSSTLLSPINDANNEKDSSDVKIADGDNLKNSSEVTNNNSVNIADTLLPGNQEAFKEKSNKIPDKRNLSLNKKTHLQNDRKRARSQNPEPKSIKRNLSKMKSISDTEGSNPSKGTVLKKSELSTLKQVLPVVVTSLNMTSEKCENTPVQEEQADDNSQNTVTKNSAEIENPCLKNVSLYAEQFSTQKYTDSDTSNTENDKNIKGRRIKMKDNKVENIEDKNNTRIDKKYKSDVKNMQNSNQMRNKNKKIDDKNKNINHIIKNIIDNNEKIEYKIKNKNDKNKKRVNKNDITDNEKVEVEAKSIGCQTSQDNISVISKSHSDSASKYGEDPVLLDQKINIRRQRALDHIFGSASGDKRQTRDTGYRKRNTSHAFNYGNMSTSSSDWTSDTGSEHVFSPPRQYGRKGRKPRKYLKPRPAKILSLEEEGGLFVMYAKKIYPIIKSGKLVKNFVTFTQEDDVEDTFWKLKYAEEKKKTGELSKLLNDAKANKQEDPSRVSPVLPTTTLNSSARSKREDTVRQVERQTDSETTTANPVQDASSTMVKPNPEPTNNVKIKYIRKNQVELEGHWSQVNPVLDHVVQLLHKEPETITISSTRSSKHLESGKCTPVDEIVEKVNQRENEIAEEIERYYKEETMARENPPPLIENNVTKRRGRPTKSPTAPFSPAKKPKLDIKSETEETTGKTEQYPAPEAIATRKTLRTRAPKNILSETNQTANSEANQSNMMRTRRSTSRISQANLEAKTEQSYPENDEEVRYKFASTPPTNKKSYTNKSKKSATKSTPQRKSKSATTLLPSPGNILNSIERTQGYQNTEFSPSSLCIKESRKSRLSLSTHSKQHYTTCLQQRTNPNMTDDITSESSNSFQGAPIESMTFQNSTITSEMYKSESYRLLMINDPSHKKHTSKLRRIIETSPPSKDFDENKKASNEIATSDYIDSDNKENMIELLQVNTDNENSSNVSLPTSPVLSIVENISISKTLLSSMDLDDYPIDDKREDIDATDQIMLNGLMTPDVDVTMPLMEQECGIEKSSHDGKAYHYNLSVSKTVPAVSESLLNKINTVNIGDPSLSESLNVKLRDLLLESTKKRFKNKNTINIETKDLETKDKSELKKDNTRKRSSTPRKRQRTRKLTLTTTEPRLVKEHVESCCRRGRQSCPPIILISDHDANAMITPIETAQFITTRGRKKKDIIKVKIVKPKAKAQDKQNDRVDITDSGINDTESEIKLHVSNESVDLIHNHSDTCLNAHECMGDSIKIIDNTASSIISLDSNSAHSDIIVRRNTVGNLTQELFSSDAQDGSDVIKELDFAEPRQVNSATTTVYHTPLGTQSSPTSIMTDDLSDEVLEKPVHNKRWYLFSEDESSNTNCFDINNLKAVGYGAKLEQIFPVTCAVPDLSTITEMSRENGDSKKFCDDTNTRDNLNSPSIFI